MERGDRRKFFKASMAALGSLFFGGLVIAGHGFLNKKKIRVATLSNHKGAFEPEEKKSDGGGLNAVLNSDGSYEIEDTALPFGAFGILALEGAPRILVNSDKGFRLFEATCTHLGCLVKWNNSLNKFMCPCHGGEYDENGKVIAGPPPGPLKEHKVSQAEGKVTIVLV